MRGISLLYAAVAVGSGLPSVLAANLADQFKAYNSAFPGLKKLSSGDDAFRQFVQSTNVVQIKPPTATSPAVSTANTTATIVPKTYLVQLSPGATLGRRGVGVGAEHAIFHKRASTLVKYNTRFEFKNPDLFLGLSIKVQDNSNATTLKTIPGVVNVWPVKSVPRPKPWGYPTGDMTVGNTTYHETAYAGLGADVNAPHRMTGVDKLHALGIKGKGMKIAAMDTGVDYHHPALGGCFGHGCKIAFGKAFVDDDAVYAPSDDPLATCIDGGHGTHVSGIIGMQDPPFSTFGLVGVAPEATLGMYRIFGCEGGADTDIIMLAFEQAVVDGVDVLSISLGSTDQWQEDDPFASVTAALEAKGIAVVVAAGNEGGPAWTSSPAIGAKVIAIGSADNEKFPTVYTATDGKGNTFQYSGSPWPLSAPKEGLKVYDFLKLAANTTSPEGCSSDAWEAVVEAIPEPSKSIIAAPASSACSWGVKLEAAAAYGLPYALVYAVEEGGVFVADYNSLEPEIPDFGITLSVDDGTKLLKAMDGDSDYRLYFNSKTFVSTKQPSAGLMSYFSSEGPTSDTLAIKPQLSAPGESILSTWPLSGTGYAILSGTSMSTPYAAASFALVKSRYPHESVQQIRERLQSNSKSIPYTFDSTIRDSVTQQGAGLVDVFGAVFSGSTVSPSELNLGDLDSLTAKTVTITNNSPFTKTYTITHEPAGEACLLPYRYTLTFDANPPSCPDQYKYYATVDFSTTTVAVRPGRSATFTATFHPPTDIPDENLPVYSGFIKVASGSDSMTVTYLGQPYSRQKADYIDHGNSTGMQVPILFNSHDFGTPILDLLTVDFNVSGVGYPYLEWITLQSIVYFRAELVPYNTSFVPDFYGFTSTPSNPHGVPNSSLPLVYPTSPLNFTSAGLTSYGISTYQDGFARPSGFLWYLDSYLTDEYGNSVGRISAGDYRAVLRVLRWGADWTKKESYQSWLSPVIRFTGAS